MNMIYLGVLYIIKIIVNVFHKLVISIISSIVIYFLSYNKN